MHHQPLRVDIVYVNYDKRIVVRNIHLLANVGGNPKNGKISKTKYFL